VFKFYTLYGQLSDSSLTFEAITVVLLKICICCDMIPCHWASIYWCSEGSWCPL